VEINGYTRPTAVIGWPVTQSLSPTMHNAAYQAMQLNWACLPCSVPDQRALLAFCEAARRLSFVGFNVTMPYKQAVAELCDEVATLAQMAGAVNTVHCVDGRLIGYNTDGRGLLETLADEAGFDPAGRSVAIIGAGGAAAAAVTAMMIAKASSLAIVNRDVSRAEALLERMADRMRALTAEVFPLDAKAAEVVNSADLVIQATPVGMKPDDPSPIPSSWLREGQIVLDMVYRRGSTAFVSDATAAGATAFNGLGMLVAQGALAIDIWAGEERAQVHAPRDVMRTAAEAEMERLSPNGAADGNGEL
jgi:shikimate dehydrogenase